MVADRRLYLTADKSGLVEEGSVDAAFLYCSPGQEVDEEELGRLLQASGVKVIPEAKAIVEAPANKAIEIPPAVKRKPGRPVGWRKPKVNG
jgi:hypothetical protein